MFCCDRVRDIDTSQEKLDLEYQEVVRSYEEKLKEKDEEMIKVRIVLFIPDATLIYFFFFVVRLTMSLCLAERQTDQHEKMSTKVGW